MIQRIGYAIVSLFVVATATFFLMKSVPGDPLVDEKGLSEEVLTQLRAYYHLDYPLVVQYGCSLPARPVGLGCIAIICGKAAVYFIHYFGKYGSGSAMVKINISIHSYQISSF